METISELKPKTKKPETQMKRITSYQALWKPQENRGHFWFTYFDGDRQRTDDLDGENFKIILEVLDTDRPIFVNHVTSSVSVHWPDSDLVMGAWA